MILYSYRMIIDIFLLNFMFVFLRESAITYQEMNESLFFHSKFLGEVPDKFFANEHCRIVVYDNRNALA
jgi:hypothetical protein